MIETLITSNSQLVNNAVVHAKRMIPSLISYIEHYDDREDELVIFDPEYDVSIEGYTEKKVSAEQATEILLHIAEFGMSPLVMF